MSLSNKIEAILFIKGDSVSYSYLSNLLNEKEEDIKKGIDDLKNILSNRGVVLIEKDDKIFLGTNPEYSSLIELITKDELNKDIGKAGIETLSIVLYCSPVKKSEIDYIRGVNSQFIIRNLSIRGLVERVSDEKDSRSFLYKPSFQLMQYLGIKRIEELPEYEKFKDEINVFIKKDK